MEPADNESTTGKRAKSRFVIGLVGLFLAAAAGYALLYHLQSSAPPPEYPEADASDPELVSLGKDIYDADCASCHGAELQGEPDWRRRKADGTLPAPPHDETGHTWHHPDSLLFDIVKKGGQAVAPEGFVSGMPGFGETLSDREIVASLAYIKSRWPKHVLQRQALISQQSKQAD